MDSDNPFKVVVFYLLTEGKIDLGHQDGVPMVAKLVCMVTHWISLMVSCDIGYRVVMISPNHYTLILEMILSLC